MRTIQVKNTLLITGAFVVAAMFLSANGPCWSMDRAPIKKCREIGHSAKSPGRAGFSAPSKVRVINNHSMGLVRKSGKSVKGFPNRIAQPRTRVEAAGKILGSNTGVGRPTDIYVPDQVRTPLEEMPGHGRIPDLNDIADIRNHEMQEEFNDSLFGALDRGRVPAAGGPDREQGSNGGGPEGWHGPGNNTHTRDGVSVTLLHEEAVVITPGDSGSGGGSGWGGEDRNTHTDENGVSVTLGGDDAIVIQKKDNDGSGGKNDDNGGGTSSTNGGKDDSGAKPEEGQKEKQVVEKVDKGNDPDGGDDPDEMQSATIEEAFNLRGLEAAAHGSSSSGNGNGSTHGPDQPDEHGWERHRARLGQGGKLPEDGRPDEMMNPMGARASMAGIIGDTGTQTISGLNPGNMGQANQPAPGGDDPDDPRASQNRSLEGTGMMSTVLSPAVGGDGNPGPTPGPEF